MTRQKFNFFFQFFKKKSLLKIKSPEMGSSHLSKISKIPVGCDATYYVVVMYDGFNPKTKIKRHFCFPFTTCSLSRHREKFNFFFVSKYLLCRNVCRLNAYHSLNTALWLYVYPKKGTYDLFSHTFWLDAALLCFYFSWQKRSSSWPIIFI